MQQLVALVACSVLPFKGIGLIY